MDRDKVKSDERQDIELRDRRPSIFWGGMNGNSTWIEGVAKSPIQCDLFLRDQPTADSQECHICDDHRSVPRLPCREQRMLVIAPLVISLAGVVGWADLAQSLTAV